MSTIADLPLSARMLGNPSGKGGYTGGESPANREETLSWVVNWEQSGAFRDAIIGFPEDVEVAPGVIISRVIPLQSPFTSYLYASTYTFESVGKRGTSSAKPYNFVIFKVTFTVPTLGSGSDSPYYSISEQGSVRYISVPGSRYTFSDDTSPEQAISIPFPGVSYILSIFQVADIVAFRTKAVAMLETPVSSAPITIGGMNLAAGKALFETYSTESTTSTLGVQQHSAQLVINYSTLPWNSLIRADGAIDELQPLTNQTGDLNELVS